MESKNKDQNHHEKLMKWAKSTEQYVEEVRKGRVKLPVGETVSFHIKKHTLDLIANDDINSLAFDQDFFMSEHTASQKEAALIRLNFEVELDELPSEVKMQLRSVRNFLDENDISTKEKYFEAKGKYWEAIKQIRQYINNDPSLGMEF